MVDTTERLDHWMTAMIQKHGHAAVLGQFVADFDWQLGWAAPVDHERLVQAHRHLVAALNTLTNWEQEEEKRRAA